MKELTLVLDTANDKTLKKHLLSLDGIINVTIINNACLEITINYDEKITSPKIIQYEISLFLDNMNIPSLMAFDKHAKTTLSDYKIIRNDVCCEYCYKGTVEDLFLINGIEKVSSNVDIDYFFTSIDKREDLIINIKYNEALITLSKMQEIDKSLVI